MTTRMDLARSGWNYASVLAVCLVLGACTDKVDPSVVASPQAETPKQKIQTSVERLAQWPEKDLRERARKAVMEQHWVKPSGNSALEYYLALRRKLAAPDDRVETAITDIVPYAVIGMDQAIAQFDSREALRLEKLIRLADPNAPALARVKSDLEAMGARQNAAQASIQAQAAAEALAKAAQDAAKAKSALLPKTSATPLAGKATAPPTRVPVAPSVEQAAAPVPVPAPVAAPPLAQPAPSRAAVEALSTPQPPYPREALASGIKGEVTAEISINGAGEVTGVRILSASPRNVFERGVQSTVRRWKFRGNGEATTIRRTFAFN